MVFSSTVTKRGVIGSMKFRCGTFACTGTTGGDIATGLRDVEFIKVQGGGASVLTNACAVNETLPLKASGDVTIVTDNGATGFWFAIGK